MCFTIDGQVMYRQPLRATLSVAPRHTWWNWTCEASLGGTCPRTVQSSTCARHSGRRVRMSSSKDHWLLEPMLTITHVLAVLNEPHTRFSWSPSPNEWRSVLGHCSVGPSALKRS